MTDMNLDDFAEARTGQVAPGQVAPEQVDVPPEGRMTMEDFGLKSFVEGEIREMPGVIEQAIAPVKRIPGLAEKARQESIEMMNQPGLLSKAFGALEYVGSPATGVVEGIFGEPVEAYALEAGRSPQAAKFMRDLTEAAAYMTTPGEYLVRAKYGKDLGAEAIKAASGAPKKARGLKMQEYIRSRRADIDKAKLDSELWITQNIDNVLSSVEKEALPFLRQGIKDPEVLRKIGREDLIDVINRPTAALHNATKKVGGYYDEAFEFLKDYGNDPSYIENYVTQLWNIPKARKNEVMQRFATINPFLKKRTIPTLEEGIKMGLTPRTTDISKLLRIYDNFKIHAAFNKRFADQVFDMVDEDGLRLVQAAGKAPQDWKLIDHPALRKTVYKGKAKGKVKVKNLNTVITETITNIQDTLRTVPGGTAEKISSGPVKRLEEVMQGALEARGMSGPEANVYMTKLRSAYAGGKTTAGDIPDKITKSQTRNIKQVVKEIEAKYPIDIPILERNPVRVHPDIAQEMGVIFGKRITGESVPGGKSMVNALETVNAFAKKSALTGSLFHHMTLTESALGSGVGKKALAMWNPKRVYDAVKKGDYEIYKQMPLAKDAIDSGVTFGALSDVQLSKVSNALEHLEQSTRKIPGVGKVTKGIRKANDLWDKGLWDYYHNNLKLEAYNGQLVTELKKANPQTAEEITAIKRKVAGFVNDSFGGQQWELNKVLGHPKMQQILQWSLLAPDWTVSTLRQAGAPIKAAMTGDKTTARVGAKFWTRAALYNTVIAQAINYANTKRETGEGKFTWDNDPGQKLNVFIGYNDDDPTGLTRGTKRYLRTGKQFKETLEWMENPAKKLGGKLSPAMGEFFKQGTGVNFGSGFPTEFKDANFFDSIFGRAKSMATNFVPFSLRSYMKRGAAKNFMFTWPTSKGMTPHKTIKEFEYAIRSKNKAKRIPRVFMSALENNIEPLQYFQMANNNLKRQERYGYKDLAENIAIEMKDLDNDAKKDLLSVYARKGVLIPPVIKELNAMFLDKQKVLVEQQALETPTQTAESAHTLEDFN